MSAAPTAESLASVTLMRGLPLPELSDILPLLTRREFSAGEVVFWEGEPGRSMMIVAAGRLEVARRVPGAVRHTLAHVGPGEPLGELALLTGAPRSATVWARENTIAWELDAVAFELLRRDGRPIAVELVRRIGESALTRLRREYARIAEALAAAATGTAPASPPSVVPHAIEHVMPETGEVAYLSDVLFFRELAPDAIVEATSGGRRLAVPRGMKLVAEGAPAGGLLIVLRGALESTIRRGGCVRRVRLSGPGRAAAHLSLEGGASPVDVRARERSVVLELSRARVDAIVRSPEPVHKAIAARIHIDAVRALHDAQRPHGLMASALVRYDAAAA